MEQEELYINGWDLQINSPENGINKDFIGIWDDIFQEDYCNFFQKNPDEAMAALFADHTVLVVAHRLSTIKNVDNILLIDKGRVVQEGNFEKLSSEKSDLFYKLLKLSN